MFVFIQHIPLLVLYGGFSLTHMVFSCFLYDMFRHFGLYVLMSDNLCHNSGKVLRDIFLGFSSICLLVLIAIVSGITFSVLYS